MKRRSNLNGRSQSVHFLFSVGIQLFKTRLEEHSKFSASLTLSAVASRIETIVIEIQINLNHIAFPGIRKRKISIPFTLTVGYIT